MNQCLGQYVVEYVKFRATRIISIIAMSSMWYAQNVGSNKCVLRNVGYRGECSTVTNATERFPSTLAEAEQVSGDRFLGPISKTPDHLVQLAVYGEKEG
jgi:hypothetical protein